VAAAATAGAGEWRTDFENSNYMRTPTYAQTIEYCERLAAASPWIHFTSFGASSRGRQLPLLVIDRNGNFTPEAVRRSGNAVFLIQAGIHSGEIDGKDAGLMLARDIAVTRERASLVDHVTVLFIPIFNVDGHERSGPFNRPNQNGPVDMGWRTNAANLNLNRDYLKADTPEVRAWLSLFCAWLPEFFADCHVTDGANYQYVVTYALELDGNMDESLSRWTADRYLAPVETRMEASGFPIIRYQWYRRGNDPKSGIVGWAAPPRFSEGYTALQNRPGLLIETHSLKDYKTRVMGTYAMLAHTLEILGQEHETLRRLVADADRRTTTPGFRSQPYPLTFAMDEGDSVMVDFLGYEYTVETSDLTGGEWYRYTDRPVEFRIPYFKQQKVAASARLPEAYIIPPEWEDLIERLELHGVAVARTRADATIPVERYRFRDPVWAQAPFEGRHTVTFTQETFAETLTFPAGSAVVDMNQRAARVAAHALEPAGPDSFVLWGFFDAIFEQKEYIESYVIEELARRMLAGDTGLRAEFDAWRADHPDADTATVRDWFYLRSPYRDPARNVYPVGRILERAVVSRILD
jgi:hypothetical protein